MVCFLLSGAFLWVGGGGGRNNLLEKSPRCWHYGLEVPPRPQTPPTPPPPPPSRACLELLAPAYLSAYVLAFFCARVPCRAAIGRRGGGGVAVRSSVGSAENIGVAVPFPSWRGKRGAGERLRGGGARWAWGLGGDGVHFFRRAMLGLERLAWLRLAMEIRDGCTAPAARESGACHSMAGGYRNALTYTAEISTPQNTSTSSRRPWVRIVSLASQSSEEVDGRVCRCYARPGGHRVFGFGVR